MNRRKMTGLFFSLLVTSGFFILVACGGGGGGGTSDGTQSSPLIVSGTLSKDTTWSGEIHVMDNVFVPSGVTLTISPGTIVKFKHSRDYKNMSKSGLLIREGIVKAIGTASDPIWFTSDAPDPINGDWEGIAIENSKQDNQFRYVIIEYAFIGIRFWTSSGTVSHSIIRWINAEGIYMERSDPVIESNTIYATGFNGIAMEQFNEVVIRNNKITDNQGSGIHGEATKAVIANNIIRNGRTGITFDDFSEVTLRNNLIENIRSEGVHFINNVTGNVYSNKIRSNGMAILSTLGSQLIANNNDIYNNSTHIALNTMTVVDLQNNWWGTTDEREILGKIQSDAIVSVRPFLNQESVTIHEPIFDYQDVKKTNLGYIPGDFEDKYPYIYPDVDETREVLKKICGAQEGFVDSSFGWSLAWDGNYLWRSKHAGAADLVKISPETGEILAEFENPGIAQDRGIAFDGQSLWVNDFTQKKVFEIDPNTGKILSSFAIPDMGSGSSGIAWDGEYLYLVNWLKQNELHKVDRKGNFIGIVTLEGEGGISITFDGQYFWESPCGPNKVIRKYDKHGKRVGEIYPAAFGGEAMAHDGQYLWVLHRTQENWSDPKLYKIKVINDQILLK